MKDWVRDSEANDTGFKRIFLGNKFDLQNIRQVQFTEAKDWADKKQIECMEVSAKLGTNVNKAIMRLVEICLENKTKEEIMNSYGLNDNKKDNAQLKKVVKIKIKNFVKIIFILLLLL